MPKGLKHNAEVSEARYRTYREIVRLRTAGRKLQSKRMIIALEDSRATYDNPRLFINTRGEVLEELMELSENQADPVYGDDDILDAIDSESMCCGSCIRRIVG